MKPLSFAIALRSILAIGALVALTGCGDMTGIGGAPAPTNDATFQGSAPGKGIITAGQDTLGKRSVTAVHKLSNYAIAY